MTHHSSALPNVSQLGLPCLLHLRNIDVRPQAALWCRMRSIQKCITQVDPLKNSPAHAMVAAGVAPFIACDCLIHIQNFASREPLCD